MADVVHFQTTRTLGSYRENLPKHLQSALSELKCVASNDLKRKGGNPYRVGICYFQTQGWTIHKLTLNYYQRLRPINTKAPVLESVILSFLSEDAQSLIAELERCSHQEMDGKRVKIYSRASLLLPASKGTNIVDTYYVSNHIIRKFIPNPENFSLDATLPHHHAAVDG